MRDVATAFVIAELCLHRWNFPDGTTEAAGAGEEVMRKSAIPHSGRTRC